MSTTPQIRAEAISTYVDDLGLAVFPYDRQGLPFRDWPNPHMAQTGYRREVAERHQVSTFGAALNGMIVVIDIDADRGGDLSEAEAVFGPLPPTFTVNTPSSDQNFHLFYRVDTPLRTSKTLAAKFEGIDFLGLGSHVKGYTSWRRFDGPDDPHYEAASYNRQYPYLSPAPLPAAWEAAWRDTMVASVDELHRLELTEAEQALPKHRLTPKERSLLQRWIRESLQAITEAVDGERFTVMSRHVFNVYRCGVTLTGSTSAFDQRIIDAYQASGGKASMRYLADILERTKIQAARFPKPRPAVSAFHRARNKTIGEWSDAATADVPARNKLKRATIAALMREADSEGQITTAVSVIAARYGLGHRSDVGKVIQELEADGWLTETGQSLTVSLRTVNHYSITKHPDR